MGMKVQIYAPYLKTHLSYYRLMLPYCQLQLNST